MTPLRPLGGRILVTPLAPPDVTDSGIVLCPTYKDPDVMGRVVAVGTNGHVPAAVVALNQLRRALIVARHHLVVDAPDDTARVALWDALIAETEGFVDTEPAVSEDDVVIFAASSGQDVVIDGDRYVLLGERDVLAVVEET